LFIFLNIKIVKQKVKNIEDCKFIPSNILAALRKSIIDNIVKKIENFPRFTLKFLYSKISFAIFISGSKYINAYIIIAVKNNFR
jgi:hypothetical protein